MKNVPGFRGSWLLFWGNSFCCDDVRKAHYNLTGNASARCDESSNENSFSGLCQPVRLEYESTSETGKFMSLASSYSADRALSATLQATAYPDEGIVRVDLRSQESIFYHDYSSLALESFNASSNPRRPPRFPEKLFEMLDRAEAEGLANTISWQPHGRCFIVWRVQEFTSLLPTWMPGMTRWKSFQKQLNLWGFRRLTKGRDLGGYFHEYFLRYRPHLLSVMRRVDKSRQAAGSKASENEPDFYAMKFVTPLMPRTDNGNDEGTTTSDSLETTAILSAVLDSKSGEHASIDGVSPFSDADLASTEGQQCEATHSSGGTILGFTESQSIEPGLCNYTDSRLFALPPLLKDVPLSPSLVASIEATSTSRHLLYETAGLNQRRHSVVQADQMTDNQGAESKCEPEPRALPPVIVRQGEIIGGAFAVVPVAQHPSFVQIGPQEYYRVISDTPRSDPLSSGYQLLNGCGDFPSASGPHPT
jgi:HSF-type DNA-binding